MPAAILKLELTEGGKYYELEEKATSATLVRALIDFERNVLWYGALRRHKFPKLLAGGNPPRWVGTWDY
jgi:hypothetical protein